MKAGASDYLTKPIDGEALVAALARVKRSPRQELLAREHLLSVVAHDLRAPLSIIALAASAGEAALDVPHRLDMIRRAATRMTKLVEDLLDVSRLETGSLALDLSPRRTREILDGVEEAIGPIAEANGVHLECESEDELEVTCALDRIVQVLVNLASNAVSVTPSGRRVVVRAMRRGGRARFEVEDEGPGIAHEHLPRIFERGFRLDTGRRRGAGLGLTIARGIVEAHGGTLGVESVVGRGSLFAFDVPLSGASRAAWRVADDDRAGRARRAVIHAPPPRPR